MASRTALRLSLRASNVSRPTHICSCKRIGSQWQTPVRTAGLRTPVSRGFASTSILQEKKYTEDHEWVELSEDGTTGTIGVSEYAAKQLGDVVYVELPVPDSEVQAGDTIGAVESVKSAADINTPVGGTITAANDVLQEKPGTINKGPEGDGWIARIKIQDTSELESLMGKEDYDKFIEE